MGADGIVVSSHGGRDRQRASPRADPARYRRCRRQPY
ncbi:hypothetical protein [Pseudorhizobium pelagicum]